MQRNDHVTNDFPNGRPRCSWVELEGDYLVYVLDTERKYDPLDTRPQLHLRFLSLKTDEELVGFTRAWGPLMPTDVWRRGNEFGGKTHRSWYWTFQAALKAELELVQSFRSDDEEKLKAALLKHIAAEDGYLSTITSRTNSRTARELSRVFALNPDRNPQEWVPIAKMSRLREVAAWSIGEFFLTFALSATWRRGKPEIAWEPYIVTLEDAIRWHFWSSLTGQRPLTMCEECQTVFQPDSAHPRKFCSYLCAHRVAMRMWRKKKPQEQGKRKRGKHAQTKKA